MMRLLKSIYLACGGKSLLGDERGAAAVEFAFLAPVLAFACLATVDCGLAINQKMAIDDSLRAASEGALADLGEDDVHHLLDAVAAEHFTNQLTTDVKRFCACPESVSSAVACGSATCAGSAHPYLYYRLTGATEYHAIILPQIALRGSLLVQVE